MLCMIATAWVVTCLSLLRDEMYVGAALCLLAACATLLPLRASDARKNAERTA